MKITYCAEVWLESGSEGERRRSGIEFVSIWIEECDK
jgi:hypothetical protein